jgi:hypothetical protein
MNEFHENKKIASIEKQSLGTKESKIRDNTKKLREIHSRRNWAEAVIVIVENAGRAAYPEHKVVVSMIGIEPPKGVERDWKDAEAFVCAIEDSGNYNDICFRVFVGFHNNQTGAFEFAKHVEIKAGKIGNFFWPPREDWASTPLIYFQGIGGHVPKAITP